MDILREKLRCTPMGASLRKGSKSNSTTETTNQDNRVTAGTVGLTGSDGNVIKVNDTDAVKAIAGMGAETIAKTGEAVVKLNQAGMDANFKAWDSTVQAGTQLVDKLIDASTTLGSAAISSFQPAENKASDTSLKLGMIAAAGVAATLLLSKTK
jgi:hypothetical protein